MRVSLIMGSVSDKEFVEEAKKILDEFGIEYEVKVLSCHRSPNLLREYIREAEQKGVKIFVAFASKAAALPGVLASYTTLPVIGVPLRSDFLDGFDSIISMTNLPKFCSCLVSSLGKAGAINAALSVVKIFALQNQKIKEELEKFYKRIEEQIRIQNKNP